MLYRRVHCGKTRNEAHESRQLLTKYKEKALAQWISTSTVTGHPVQHSVIHDIAEKLRQERVSQQSQSVPPIAPTWVPQFLRRHPYLKVKKRPNFNLTIQGCIDEIHAALLLPSTITLNEIYRLLILKHYKSKKIQNANQHY